MGRATFRQMVCKVSEPHTNTHMHAKCTHICCNGTTHPCAVSPHDKPVWCCNRASLCCLQNVNLLYLGGDVWILFDRDYNRRFWCLLESYLSMRQASASGLISSLHDPHHTIICMGSTADLPDKYKDMLESETEKPLDKMLGWLKSDDVDVTNQTDKDKMILRMSEFEPIVQKLFG